MAYYDELGQLYGNQNLDLDELEKQAMLLRANQRQQADELNQRADSSNMLAKTIAGLGAGLESALQGTGGSSQKAAQAIQNVDQMDLRRRQQALLNEQAGLKSLQPIIELRKQRQAFENKKELIPLEAEQRLRFQLETLAATGDQRAQLQLNQLNSQMAMQRERLQNQKEIEAMRQSGAAARASQKVSSGGRAGKPSETDVYGYQVLPGASPTKDDAKKVKEAVAAYHNFQSRIDDLENAVKKYGLRTLPGTEGRSQVERATKSLITEGKNAEQLGAISGPDMGLILGIVGDPLSIKSMAMGDQAYLNVLGQARGASQSKHDNMIRTYGYQIGSGSSLPKKPSSSLNPDQRQKIIELLKSKVK